MTLTHPRFAALDEEQAYDRRGPRLWVSSLALSDFRSYRSLKLRTESAPVVLSGPNGAGKTNLLEALSFLSPGRGLRGARLGEVDRRAGPQAPPWAVAAEVDSPQGRSAIGTAREPEAGRERRIVKIDGKLQGSQAPLAGALSLVWLTPEMDSLFLEGPGARRRLLDRFVFGLDPAHAERLSAHERSRRARACLLREGRGDSSWLGALERTLAEHAVAIAAARLDFVRRLNAALEEVKGPFPCPRLELRGAPEALLGEMPALEAEERLCARLASTRGPDAETGGAEGAHRSDLVAFSRANGISAANCSTGEQKAFLVAILLAHARLLTDRRAMAPILLLDEVAAHLDGGRRQALFEAILGLKAQAWLTGTERAIFTPLRGRAQFLSVESSMVSEG